MNQTETYRPKSSLLFAGIGLVFCGFFLWSSFYQGGTTSEITSSLVTAFVATCIYMFLIKPKVDFQEGGIIITNPTEEITIGWADVIDIDARWALAIATDNFIASAWAAPAPGRHRSRSIHVTEIRGLGIELDGSIRPADSPRSDSGAAAHLARINFQKFKMQRGLQSLATERRRNFRPLVLAGVFLIAAITINLFGH